MKPTITAEFELIEPVLVSVAADLAELDTKLIQRIAFCLSNTEAGGDSPGVVFAAKNPYTSLTIQLVIDLLRVYQPSGSVIRLIYQGRFQEVVI